MGPSDAFAMLDEEAAQFFYGFEKFLPRLLDEHLTQDGAERTNVAAERAIFRRFAGWGSEFCKTGLLVVDFP